ncbi:MAG: glycosyltransferase [Candidatus Delongbacteria bacterium]|nr:glycosyltransferase [Candidatus Delongbacteria bacterium]
MFFSVIVPTYNRYCLLQRLLNSLAHQSLNRSEYEIIVVDDGSSDQPVVDLAEGQAYGPIRMIRQDHQGPAAARNRGAAEAQGTYLVFTDDDCVVPETWLESWKSILRDESISAAGGSVQNRVSDSFPAELSQYMISFLQTQYNSIPGKAVFLTANNMVIRRQIFAEIGGFDTRFRTAGGEDREIAERLVHQGFKVIEADNPPVLHYHRFTLLGYARQQIHYGQGAFFLYYLRSLRRQSGEMIGLLSLYQRMIRQILRDYSPIRALLMIFGMVVSQCLVLGGYYRAQLSCRSGCDTEMESNTVTGVRDVAGRFIPLVVGGILHSMLGGVNIILVSRLFQLDQFGLFSAMISLQIILSCIAGLGLNIAVIRLGAADGRPVFRMALITQLGTITVVAMGCWVLKDTVLSRLNLPPGDHLMAYILVGMAGMSLWDLARGIFQAVFNFWGSVRLNISAFAFRTLCLLAAYWVFRPHSIVPVLIVYMVSYWFSLILEFPRLRTLFPSIGSFSFRGIGRLLSYGGWISLSRLITIILQQIPTLILVGYKIPDQAGIYSIALYASFFQGILFWQVGSYFMPYASHLNSRTEIMAFLKSAYRLNSVYALACIPHLIGAGILIPILFGEPGHAAAWVFFLLTLGQYLDFFMIPVHSVFHYLMKPWILSIQSIIRLAVQIGLSIMLAGSLQAEGMGFSVLAGGLAAAVFMITMLHIER